MSNLKTPINYKMLENELDDALRADKLYKLQNDAKIRAIEQRVPTYEQFRGMVQTAHLKPLERCEMHKKVEVSWNHCYNNNENTVLETHDQTKLLITKSKEASNILFQDKTEPLNSAEFFRIWKNLSGIEEKFEYLTRHRTSLKEKFCKVEIPSTFLEEFFKLSLQICSEETLSHIIQFLKMFSECNRFYLNLAMVSDSEKCIISLLFEKLLSLAQNCEITNSINGLKKIYKIL